MTQRHNYNFYISQISSRLRKFKFVGMFLIFQVSAEERIMQDVIIVIPAIITSAGRRR